MNMKKNIAVWGVLLALMVALVPPCSARAEESTVVEWNNFGEYWLARGYAIEDLPFDYDAEKLYMFFKHSNSRWYLFTVDAEVIPDFRLSGNTFYWWKQSGVDVYVASVASGVVTGWNNYTNEVTSYFSLAYRTECECFYSDFDIAQPGNNYWSFHKTKTGESVSFQFALADMTDDLKATLQGYSSYVVAKVPYRVNDWQSEQIMIAVSNGNRVILRDEAYNQIQFSTGSGYDSGESYIYCSECCQWYPFNTSKGYILGDTVAVGGATPEVMWTNCDIYYEDGTGYGLTNEVWQKAIPYSDGTEEPEEEKEIVTDGFPRLFEVEATVAYIYNSASTNSTILLAIVSGKSGLVHGLEYDSDNVPWYKVSVSYNGNTVEGYVVAEDIDVSFSAPSVSTPTPVPTVAPGGGSSGGESEEDTTLREKITEITAFVASVPLIIGVLFSFLPPWCLTLAGIGFAILVVIMVRRGTIG